MIKNLELTRFRREIAGPSPGSQFRFALFGNSEAVYASLTVCTSDAWKDWADVELPLESEE